MTVCWNRSPRTFSFDSEKTGSLPSRDGPRHDRHEAHQRQCNTEDDHKAGGVGDARIHALDGASFTGIVLIKRLPK